MTILKEITVEFQKDLYKLEILESTLGKKYYSMYCNGVFLKTRQRMAKDLKEFFHLNK